MRGFLTSLFIHVGAGILILVFYFASSKTLTPKRTEVYPFATETENHPLIKNQRISEQKATPIEAENKEVLTSSENGSTHNGESDYANELRSKIIAHQFYPILARKKHLEGEVMLLVELNDHGDLISVKSILQPKSAENLQILVDAAIQAVREAAPFSAVPKGIQPVFRIPIKFQIE